MKNFIGQSVIHKKFGKGKVISQNEDLLEIKFETGESKVMPIEAFETFIKFSDQNLQKEALLISSKIKEDRQTEKDQKMQIVLDRINLNRILSLKEKFVAEIKDELKSTQIISNTALAGYQACCKKFGWDISKSKQFGPQKPLFATEATPENYSVWFISHNNWNKSKSSNWENIISEKLDTITEIWDETDDSFFNTEADRVVFANKYGVYIFLGIYRLNSIDPENNTRHYIQISNTYKPSEN